MNTKGVRDIAKHFKWMFIIQGVLAVLMALLVLLYPPIIVALVAATFLWMGTMAFVMAWRVDSFSKEAGLLDL